MDQFLTPVLALILWTLLIWIVMYARRIPAMNKAGVKPQDAAHPGSLNVLPSGVRAAADNYNHLMEQPTIFYALMFYLHLSGSANGDSMALTLAWAYVGLRVLHSLTQITFNAVVVRFALFAISSIVLIVMAVRAVSDVF